MPPLFTDLIFFSFQHSAGTATISQDKSIQNTYHFFVDFQMDGWYLSVGVGVGLAGSTWSRQVYPGFVLHMDGLVAVYIQLYIFRACSFFLYMVSAVSVLNPLSFALLALLCQYIRLLYPTYTSYTSTRYPEKSIPSFVQREPSPTRPTSPTPLW